MEESVYKLRQISYNLYQGLKNKEDVRNLGFSHMTWFFWGLFNMDYKKEVEKNGKKVKERLHILIEQINDVGNLLKIYKLCKYYFLKEDH